MEAPLSSSESLTSRSTDDSMDLDAFEEKTPGARSPISGSTSNTPIREDAEKGIIVDAPGIEMAEGSAILLNPDEEDDEDVVTPYYKRKRASINYNMDDTYDKMQRTPNDEPVAKRPRSGPKVRGVIIGVWRDSSEIDDADKHVIYGFIDIHDRLRTRIYGMNRRGEELIGNIPMGAGGCWVTFPRIIFDEHLRPLNSAEIKEYVKLRSEAKPETTVEERQEADGKAVLKAKQIVAEETASSGARPVVHRLSLGRGSRGGHRESLPRQTLHKTPSFQAVNAANIQTPKASPFAEGKPHGVLLGYWADSDEPRLEDKHAVFGVLSGTDCFRVKVQRVTRDGRYVDGNFPIGAGALWLHYDKVVFEPHLAGLTRPEVKEYCRVRQRDLEHRESEKERKANEMKAVEVAKNIVAQEGLNNGLEQHQLQQPQQQHHQTRVPPLEMETRHSARSELKMAARQQAEAEAAAEKARKEKSDAIERQHEKTRKEVAMAEAVIQEAAQQELKNNIKKLNKVWVAQQAATSSTSPRPSLPSGPNEEVKFHNGIKYERKQNGPFQGKLVSSAQILSIDGEDYVEYRVLTKPSFF